MGGEHKCPLCEATFTRPQHVGRHLRAHTGDRPYECKDCPLKFARSDLLSRHVNKAHGPQDGPPKEKGKKARRKSLPAPGPPLPPPPVEQQSSAESLRRSSMSRLHDPAIPPPLQAQSLYPHHPLLAGEPQGWTSNQPVAQGLSPTAGLNGLTPPDFFNPFSSPQPIAAAYGAGPSVLNNPYGAIPMRVSGSDQSLGSSSMGRGSSGLSAMGYEFGFKKRACDQCNHSKVRCDFAEPCHRCATRNVSCTYLKPTKSRSMAPPTQRLSLPMSSGYSNTFLTNNTSVSPQTTYSSPHSTDSPPTATLPPNFGRPPTTAPPQLDKAHSMPYIPVTAMPWGNSYPDVTVPSPSMSTWNQSIPTSVDPLAVSSTSPQHFIPGAYTSPPGAVSIQPSAPPIFAASYVPANRLSVSSGASPQNHLAGTPSLTASHTTSPSSSEGPAERRSFSAWTDSHISPGIVLPPTGDPMTMLPYSPTQISPLAPLSSFQPDLSSSIGETFVWQPPAPATIDPRFQFRTSYSTDDEDTATRPPSSAASSFHDYEEAAAQAMQHRRRSSAHVWASAFDGMSLAEEQITLGPLPLPDPFTASQLAQQIQQNHPISAKRPTFPMISMDGSDATERVTSSGDMKDLWKLFMSDATPSTALVGDKLAEAGRTAKTPSRPGMGLRRRSSMPEFASPLLTAKAHAPFFAPPPTDEINLSMPPPANDGALNTWKKEIRARQSSFSFVPTANEKMSRISPSPATGNIPLVSPTSQIPAQPNINPKLNTGRPVASVLQHNPALFQTLAPERSPSFGMNDLPVSIPNSASTPVPTQPRYTPHTNNYIPTIPPYQYYPQQQHQQQAQAHLQQHQHQHPHQPISIPNTQTGYAQHKVTSSLARPGNKRLASQTLVPDLSGKNVKSSLGYGQSWEEVVGEDYEVAGNAVGVGVGGSEMVGQGMYAGGVDWGGLIAGGHIGGNGGVISSSGL